jgi:hypothetical protein
MSNRFSFAKTASSAMLLLAATVASAEPTSFQFTYSGTTYEASTMTGTGFNNYFADGAYLTATDTGGYFMPWYGNVTAATAFAEAGYNSGISAFSTTVNAGYGAAAFIFANPDGYNLVAMNGGTATTYNYRLIPNMTYAVATAVLEPVAVPEIDGALLPQALALMGASALFVRRRRVV